MISDFLAIFLRNILRCDVYNENSPNILDNTHEYGWCLPIFRTNALLVAKGDDFSSYPAAGCSLLTLLRAREICLPLRLMVYKIACTEETIFPPRRTWLLLPLPAGHLSWGQWRKSSPDGSTAWEISLVISRFRACRLRVVSELLDEGHWLIIREKGEKWILECMTLNNTSTWKKTGSFSVD